MRAEEGSGNTQQALLYQPLGKNLSLIEYTTQASDTIDADAMAPGTRRRLLGSGLLAVPELGGDNGVTHAGDLSRGDHPLQDGETILLNPADGISDLFVQQDS
jgi:hypothetical protein